MACLYVYCDLYLRMDSCYISLDSENGGVVALFVILQTLADRQRF